ncbi:hypothetical protein D2Q93_07230 [Alicyclobacillaceae bacterium I2511]|nr:hypothetical protein D2Q93_07230 [Alicyclobacillaceae bacterium I2511]
MQREQDRQRRANNPECYDERGCTIKGKHPTKKSRHQRETKTVLAGVWGQPLVLVVKRVSESNHLPPLTARLQLRIPWFQKRRANNQWKTSLSKF